MIILKTPRLYLRTLQDEDAIRMASYRNKEEVKRFQSWDEYTLKEAKDRVKECKTIKDLTKLHSNYHLAIINSTTNHMIGDLYVQIFESNILGLGYTIDSYYWRQGYAYEIISAFLEYMKQLSFEYVMCYAYFDNYKSISLLKKLGFELFDKSLFYGDEGYMKKL